MAASKQIVKNKPTVSRVSQRGHY